VRVAGDLVPTLGHLKKTYAIFDSPNAMGGSNNGHYEVEDTISFKSGYNTYSLTSEGEVFDLIKSFHIC
jgi:hypothetical protein